MQHWLVGIDVDRVQEYVFESPRLPEIGGASRLLQETERRLKDRFESQNHRVVVGGGSMLVWVEGDRAAADEVARQVESTYLRETLVCTATTTIVEWDGQDLQEARAELAHQLRRAKDEKKTWPWFNSLPHALRCASCSKRPAQHRDTRVPGEPRWVCLACKRKSEEEHRDAPPDQVRDLRQIAEHCGRGKLGVIHLDGDGVGERLQQIASWDELQSFSQALTKALNRAVNEALDALAATVSSKAPASGASGPRPYRRLFVGGDDLYLFVPGEWALEVALQVQQVFATAWQAEAESAQAGPAWGPLTLSGAVLVADPSTPVYFLHRLLLDFERHAKRWKRQLAPPARATASAGGSWAPGKGPQSSEPLGAADEGWLSFRVLLTCGSATGSAQEFFDSLLSRRPAGIAAGWEKRTLRPCPAGEVRRLLCWARKLKSEGVPLGTVLRLRDAMWRDRFEGAVELAYELARTTRPVAARILRELAMGAQSAGAEWSCGWRPIPELKRGEIEIVETPIGDLAEVWDFCSDLQQRSAAQQASEPASRLEG
jgi:hypothetical protein